MHSLHTRLDTRLCEHLPSKAVMLGLLTRYHRSDDQAAGLHGRAHARTATDGLGLWAAVESRQFQEGW